MLFQIGEEIYRTSAKLGKYNPNLKLPWKGAIPDEHTAQISNQPGTLSMANAGPNSGGSQFFINVRDNARLDWFTPGPSQHPVFGKIVEGYDVIVGITEVATGAAGKDMPNTPIMMESVTIEGL